MYSSKSFSLDGWYMISLMTTCRRGSLTGASVLGAPCVSVRKYPSVVKSDDRPYE